MTAAHFLAHKATLVPSHASRQHLLPSTSPTMKKDTAQAQKFFYATFWQLRQELGAFPQFSHSNILGLLPPLEFAQGWREQVQRHTGHFAIFNTVASIFLEKTVHHTTSYNYLYCVVNNYELSLLVSALSSSMKSVFYSYKYILSSINLMYQVARRFHCNNLINCFSQKRLPVCKFHF